MKTKKIQIVGCILLISIIIYFIISLFSSSNTASPKVYSCIQSFESDTNITVYGFYDLESYILTDELILLKDSSNHLSISLQSNRKNEKIIK